MSLCWRRHMSLCWRRHPPADPPWLLSTVKKKHKLKRSTDKLISKLAKLVMNNRSAKTIKLIIADSKLYKMNENK